MIAELAKMNLRQWRLQKIIILIIKGTRVNYLFASANDGRGRERDVNFRFLRK